MNTQIPLPLFRLQIPIPPDFGINTYGFSLYKNVLIAWDADYDTRILEFVDGILIFTDRVFMVHESEGLLHVIWVSVPDVQIRESVHIDGDTWAVVQHSLNYEEPTP